MAFERMITQTCPDCGHDMVPVFFSTRCEYCLYGPDRSIMRRGYVILDPSTIQERTSIKSYVLMTIKDVLVYKDKFANDDAVVYEVYSHNSFDFHQDNSLPAILNELWISRRIRTVMPDHRHKTADDTCFLGDRII